MATSLPIHRIPIPITRCEHCGKEMLVTDSNVATITEPRIIRHPSTKMQPRPMMVSSECVLCDKCYTYYLANKEF